MEFGPGWITLGLGRRVLFFPPLPHRWTSPPDYLPSPAPRFRALTPDDIQRRVHRHGVQRRSRIVPFATTRHGGFDEPRFLYRNERGFWAIVGKE